MSKASYWWEPHFEAVDPNVPARKRCLLCGEQVDVRAARARIHLNKAHGMSEAGAGPGPGAQSAPKANSTGNGPGGNPSASKYPRGSREWLVERTRDLVDNPRLSASEQLKAIAELRALEEFQGSGQFDDEVERGKFMEQWDRAIAAVANLRELEKRLLRDHTVRQDLMRALEETK